MKTYNKFISYSCSTLAFFITLNAGTTSEATSGCIPGDCTGYTKTADQCSGKTAIKCPFDTSKYYCGDISDTPLCSIVLTEVGSDKLNVIKEVQNITGLSLSEAKTLVESAPVTIKEGVAQASAEEIETTLTGLGASVELNCGDL